jgi:hypothetical protein
LANWSPIFGETQYLPVLAFPFVKLFQNNHLVCFEIIASILGKLFITCSTSTLIPWLSSHVNKIAGPTLLGV